MNFKTVGEILRLVVGWENDLDGLYALSEDYLNNGKSRIVAKALHKRHKNILEKIMSIKIGDYKNTEFIKNPPLSVWDEKLSVSAQASVEQYFSEMLGFEEKLLEYYKHVRDVCVYEKSRDVFDVLINLKKSQVKEIKGLMDSFDLAV